MSYDCPNGDSGGGAGRGRGRGGSGAGGRGNACFNVCLNILLDNESHFVLFNCYPTF